MKFLLRYIIPILFFFVGVRHCAATYRIEELCTLVCKNIIFLPFVEIFVKQFKIDFTELHTILNMIV